MSLIVFVLVPLGWWVTGHLLGRVVALASPGESGKRLGDGLTRWGRWVLPNLYLFLVIVGVRGAGSGLRLFGSEWAFAVLCLPCYLVPILALCWLAIHVVRDVARWLGVTGPSK
jgi:hypothetical protein